MVFLASRPVTSRRTVTKLFILDWLARARNLESDHRGRISARMQFSRKTDYGLILLRTLAPAYQTGVYCTLRAIALEYGLPLPFLEKLAGTLKRQGIVDAKKGMGGGYRLIRDPGSLTVGMVVKIFEEPPLMRCMKSSRPDKSCLLVSTCPMRRTWFEIEKKVNAVYEAVTVAQL